MLLGIAEAAPQAIDVMKALHILPVAPLIRSRQRSALGRSQRLDLVKHA